MTNDYKAEIWQVPSPERASSSQNTDKTIILAWIDENGGSSSEPISDVHLKWLIKYSLWVGGGVKDAIHTHAEEIQCIKVQKCQKTMCVWEKCFSNLEHAIQAPRLKEKVGLNDKKGLELPIEESTFYLTRNG